MAYRSSSTLASASSTSAVVPVPTGAAIGDIAVVGIYVENTDTVTPPAGFTAKVDLATSPTTRGRLVVYWKRLTAADTGNYTFTWTNLAFRSGQCALFSGRVGSGDPFDGTPGTAESTGTVTTLNVSTSPTVATGDAVGFWTNFQGGATWTAPGSYTQRQSEVVLAVETRDAVAAGSTGNVTATASIADFMKAFLGVLIPAVTIAHIGSYANTSSAPGTVGPFTPAAGDLITVFGGASASVDTAPSCTSDSGITFTLVASATRSPDTVYLFVADSLATAVSQTISFTTPNDAHTGCCVTVASAKGMSRTGASAIRQTGKEDNQGGVNPPAPSFPAAALAMDPCLGAVIDNSNPAAETPPTGWVEGFDIGFLVPNMGQESVSIDSGFTGTTVTWGAVGGGAFASLIAELDITAAPAGAVVGSPAVPRLGRGFPTPMILARNVTLGSQSTVSGPFGFTQTINAGLSFTSSDTFRTSKGLTAAILSFTGSVTKKTVTTLAAATLSFTSSDIFRTNKMLSAGVSFTSSQIHAIGTRLTGGLSFTGSLPRAIKTNLAGALSFTSSQTRRAGKLLGTAVLSFTGSLGSVAVHLFTQALNATLSFTSSQTRSIGTHLAGTLSFTSSQTRRTTKAISAGVSFTSSQTRAIRTNLAGALSFTSSQTRRTSKLLTVAVLSFTGNMATAAVHFFTQALNASLSFTSSQTRFVSKGLAGGLSFTSSQTRRTGKLVSAGLSFTSAQTHAIKTSLAGGLSFTSSQTRRTSKLLGTAVLSFTGNLATAAVHFFTQALNATLSFTGSLTTRRVFAKALSASLSFTSSQTKQTAKLLTAGLSFTGSQTKRIATTISAALGLTGLLTRLSSAIPTSGTASAARMSVPDSTPGTATAPGSSAADGVVPVALRGSGTTPTSDAGNATGPTSSAP